MYENKIVKGGEITAQGAFKSDSGAFYIMVVPKGDTASNVAMLDVKLSQNTNSIAYPFVAGVWNPVVVNSVNVKSADLSDYRIFYGETL